jgi:hypothetical protein
MIPGRFKPMGNPNHASRRRIYASIFSTQPTSPSLIMRIKIQDSVFAMLFVIAELATIGILVLP